MQKIFLAGLALFLAITFAIGSVGSIANAQTATSTPTPTQSAPTPTSVPGAPATGQAN